MLRRDITMMNSSMPSNSTIWLSCTYFYSKFMAITNSGNFGNCVTGAVPLPGQTGTNRNKPEHGIVLQEKGLTRFCSVFRFILHILALQLQQQAASQEAPATGPGL